MSHVDFSDLEEDFVETTKEALPIEDSVEKWGTKNASKQGAIYEEKCPSCRGSGNFVSYSGRIVGRCFKCDGSGKQSFRTSPETRAKSRRAAQDKKDAAATAKLNKAKAWKELHQAEASYLEANAGWSSFYRSLLESLVKFGSLTEGQLAAIQKGMAKQAEKDAAQAISVASGLDLSALPLGRYAVPSGDTRLKVRVSRAGKNSSWFGTIFVDDGAEYGQRRNYGRQKPGQAYSGQIEDELKAIAADPKAAMAAYGHLVGRCGVCNRALEDEKSVALGIGPICAGKMGWK